MHWASEDKRPDTSLEPEPYVLRRVKTAGVVVGTPHPVAGPLYWHYIDESDCNAPDYYGITDHLSSATVFRSGVYGSGDFNSFKRACLSDLYNDGWNEESESYEVSYNYFVLDLARKADCSPEELVSWLGEAVWVEFPAPVQVHFLTDFNGFVGYRAEWSDDLRDALHWSANEIRDTEDLDVELALSYGEFVPLSKAELVSVTAPKTSSKNYALEADYAFTLHRLGVRKRDAKRWYAYVNFEEFAWIHAALAGLEFVRNGDCGPVSEHISAFPELLARFDAAAGLARFHLNSLRLEGLVTFRLS